MLHYGGGSNKKNGLYAQVPKRLTAAGSSYVALGGVQPNPRLSLVKQGVELCRKENIDFISAVGGGSTIDSAKTIVFGTPYDGDVWDFFLGKAQAKKCLRVGMVLTIPAAESEMSPSCVITNDETERKLAYASELMRPVFSTLNPELCMTLSKNQAANGITDMFAHVMERHFTDTKHVDLTDRMCEVIMREIIDNGRLLMKNYDDYNLWAERKAGCRMA